MKTLERVINRTGKGIKRLACVGLVGLSLLSGTGEKAKAEGPVVFDNTNRVNIEGTSYNVYNMRVNTTLFDWESAKLDINLTNGEIYYNNEAGTITEPNPADFPVFPNLEWNTYFSVPGGYPNLAKFPGSIIAVSNRGFDVTWYDERDTGAGTFKIAQITLSDSSKGNFTGDVRDRCYIKGFSGIITDHSAVDYPRMEITSTSNAWMGDANSDGLVNDFDLSLVLSNWQTGTTWNQGNFNLDKIVDDKDLSILLDHWSYRVYPMGIPEPASLGILGVGALGYLGLSYSRKRKD